MNVTEELENV